MRRPLWMVAAGATLLVAACSATAVPETVTGEWQLRGGTVAGEEIVPIEAHPVTVVLSQDKVSGVAACNSYEADLFHRYGDIVVSGLGQTLMLCGGARMELEEAFLSALRRTARVMRDGDELILVGPEVELHFLELPAVP